MSRLGRSYQILRSEVEALIHAQHHYLMQQAADLHAEAKGLLQAIQQRERTCDLNQQETDLCFEKGLMEGRRLIADAKEDVYLIHEAHDEQRTPPCPDASTINVTNSTDQSTPSSPRPM
jgi:hypothetical protein